MNVNDHTTVIEVIGLKTMAAAIAEHAFLESLLEE